jgi:fatty-acyl-CoA synthase
VLLPLLPQSFFALYGAQAAGIANPVNPLLSATQIAEILRAAGTEVLVALGPDAGHGHRRQGARGPRSPAGAEGDRGRARDGGERDGDRRCTTSTPCSIASPPTARERPPHRAGRRAGYFHTGGTTGTPKLVRHTPRQPGVPGWAMGADAAARRSRCCSACRCSTSAAR